MEFFEESERVCDKGKTSAEMETDSRVVSKVWDQILTCEETPRVRADLRQPEIENLSVPALGDKNVGGFDVAVNNPFRVRGVERIRYLDGQREQHFHVQRATPMRCFRVMPSRNSIVINAWPFSSPMS